MKMLYILIYFVTICFILLSCNKKESTIGNLLLLEKTERKLDELFPFATKDDKFGYFNKYGKIVIHPKFTSVNFFNEGLACVRNEKFLAGYITEDGQFAIEPQFEDGGDFSEGLAAVTTKDGIGFIDKTGNLKFLLKPDILAVGAFHDDLCLIRTIKDKYGYINKSGEIVIEPQFPEAKEFKGGLAIYMDTLNPPNFTYGFIDKKGKKVIIAQFDDASNFNEELAAVKIGNLWGFINVKGETVIPPQYTFAHSFKNGKAVVKKGELYGVIDKTGKFIITPRFSFMGNFSDNGYAPASTGAESKMGYVNDKGVFVIQPEFDAADEMVNGVATIIHESKDDDLYGMINEKGKVIVKPIYRDIQIVRSSEDRLIYKYQNDASYNTSSEEAVVDSASAISMEQSKSFGNSSPKVSFDQAKSFMEKRCQDVGQIVLQSKISHFNGITVYLFLSTAYGTDQYCISMISENALEIVSSNCGSEYEKGAQWNSL